MAKDYESPSKQCDLIMKGGITSGVVYPPAVLELARVYRLRNIGGTSAGAIAAAAAAAAELARESGGFERLAQIRDQLARPGFIAGLFQPSQGASAPYRMALEALGVPEEQRSNWSAWTRAIERVCPERVAHGRAIGAVAGFGAGALFAGLPLLLASGATAGVPALLAVGAVAAASAGLGAVLGFSRAAFRSIVAPAVEAIGPNQLFGLCPGSRGADVSSPLQLTDWLTDEFDRIAGRPLDGAPLTFRDLREKRLKTDEAAEIKLCLVATNVSQGQPFLLPMEPCPYVFSEQDFRGLFPGRVVDEMIRWSSDSRNAYSAISLPTGFHRLPFGDALPVVVAVRLSLSYPILLRAVRLYSVQGSAFAEAKRKVQKSQSEAKASNEATSAAGGSGPRTPITQEQLVENWISDGGIAVNFPIHLFDAWMPTRPTFGITLEAACDGFRSPCLPEPRDFASVQAVVRPISSVGGFFAAILDTAQSFRDNVQRSLPSYRERVIQVPLEAKEGGLNIDMPADVLDALVKKGADAGALATHHFDFDEHRWVRSRVLLSRLEEEFERIHVGFGTRGSFLQTALTDYRQLLEAQLAEQSKKTPWYKPRGRKWCDEAERRVEHLLKLVNAWNEMQDEWARGHGGGRLFFRDDDPKPRGILRVTPP